MMLMTSVCFSAIRDDGIGSHRAMQLINEHNGRSGREVMKVYHIHHDNI